MKSNIIKYLSPALFFSFIIWMIFQADLDRDNLIMTIGQAVPFGDKIGHFLLFGTLALLINKALNFRIVRKWNLRFYFGSVIVLTFAICEEFTQLAFDNRTFDFVDMLFDVLGVIGLSSVGFRRRLRSYVQRVVKYFSVRFGVNF